MSSYVEIRGTLRGNLECGSAQPSLFHLLVLTAVAKTPEGIVVGFQIFAWAPK